jgi:hypothetical protein
MSTFILSIETDAGTYQHGYHLGTDERTARQIAEEAYRWAPRQDKAPGATYVRTVALMRDGKLFDCYGGSWSSEEIWPEAE